MQSVSLVAMTSLNDMGRTRSPDITTPGTTGPSATSLTFSRYSPWTPQGSEGFGSSFFSPISQNDRGTIPFSGLTPDLRDFQQQNSAPGPVGDRSHLAPFRSATGGSSPDPTAVSYRDFPPRSLADETLASQRRYSQENYVHLTESPTSRSYTDYDYDSQSRRTGDSSISNPRPHTRRRPFNQDEFDGPSQLLPLPLPQQEQTRSQALSNLPIHLAQQEQDDIVQHVDDILSGCAYHFVAKYQFPIPVERDKPRVRSPADREWTEWAYLIKRLATKRRIPARILYDNQIKQLVTTLDNSLVVRQNTRDQQPRLLRDDRYLLQHISAGTQVARILMDSLAMEQLDVLYMRTESVILERRSRTGGLGFR